MNTSKRNRLKYAAKYTHSWSNRAMEYFDYLYATYEDELDGASDNEAIRYLGERYIEGELAIAERKAGF